MIPQEATVDDDLLAGIHPLASTRREDLEPALDGSLDGIMSRRARGVEGETDTMTTMLALRDGRSQSRVTGLRTQRKLW